MPENKIPMKTLQFPGQPEVYEIVDESARKDISEVSTRLKDFIESVETKTTVDEESGVTTVIFS